MARAGRCGLHRFAWPRIAPASHHGHSDPILRGFASGAGGGNVYYPPPDLTRMGTADLADTFIGDRYDYQRLQAQVDGEESSGSAASRAARRWPRVMVLDAVPPFRDFGGRSDFSGRIATVQCFENNAAVRAVLSEPGDGRVLVVDAGGSPRAALLGDNLAALAMRNGWNGVVLNGFLRDAACLRDMQLGVKALGTYPIKSGKLPWGVRDVPVHFGGVTFRPGDYLYSDVDGVLVSNVDLEAAVQELRTVTSTG